ncbi:MAG: response regulator transcription factor [Alphaproteobacteria bacterium]|nr:response regulator transcription factor [Alphaproteobacteria bacterium]
MTILLVEDDTSLAELIATACQARGYALTHAPHATPALAVLKAQHFDVLVLDRMLPDTDGLTLLQSIRQAGYDMPVLILSALGEVEDRVQGLQAGADDYLIKPFAFDELEARLLALVRRKTNTQEILKLADLTIDPMQRQVSRGGKQIDLTSREFALLMYLYDNRQQAVTRKMLLENVWQQQFHTSTNVIDVHISKLRAKIDKGFAQSLIHTMRGVGFMMGVGDE